MKLPQVSKKFNWNYTALAFFLPFTLMAVIYFITSVLPFGSYTLLYCDNYHQYYPFFRQFREALRNGDGLQWTWSVGMGLDYLGLISYYLASPLNLLSVLLPESLTLTYFTWLMPLKLSFASLFFALMLKKFYGRNDLTLPLFGSMYALCAWALGYQWNVMWLDGFAMLPLVCLGTVMLLKERKYLLYTLSLTLAVMANYYIGFFVCIFVFLLFWCYEICRFKSIGRFFADLALMGVFTVLALGMTAVLEIPTLASLQTTYSSVNQFPDGFQLNIVSTEAQTAAKEAWEAYKAAKEAGTATFSLWFDAMKAAFPAVFSGMRTVAGQIGGGQTPNYYNTNVPNLYCGMMVLPMGFLFLMAKEIKLRDKLCGVGLLTLFVLSFLFRQLDYVWHGFHFPNMIPYRFSFLFSFVALYMAYRAFLLRDSFRLWQIGLAGVLSVALLFFGDHRRSDVLYWLFNLTFLAIYLMGLVFAHEDFPKLCARIFPKKTTQQEENEEQPPAPPVKTVSGRDKKIISLTLAGAMVLEMILYTALFFSGFSIYDYDYPKNEGDAAALFAKLDALAAADEDLFYRTEVTHRQTYNDGALNGYNGITTFSSSANVRVTDFMRCLGAGAMDSWNRYCYEESSPVSNLFLNLKYLVERDGVRDANAYFDPVITENNMTVLKNNAYLPLGFLTEKELAALKFDTSDRSFSFQNSLFSTATGLTERVWSMISVSAVTATDSVVTKTQTPSSYTAFSTGADGGKLTYTYKIKKDGFLCLDLNLWKQDDFVVYRNGEALYKENYTLQQMLSVGDVVQGDEVQIVITCLPNMEDTSVSVKAAILDESVYRRGYDILNAATLRLSTAETTRFQGTITCNRDGLLYTSIPQNGNWKAYVDGKEAKISPVGDCMVGVMLTEGDHTVEFRYENTALALGAKISGCCVFVFALIVTADRLMKKRRKR